MNIFISKKAQKELDKIPDSLAKHIATKILQLSNNPHPNNSKKLHGQNNFRFRIGSFRVIYSITSKEITILRIADRKTIYR